MEITFEVLNNYIDVVNHNLKRREWNENSVISYYGVNGINVVGIRMLIEREEHRRVIDYVKTNTQNIWIQK